MPEREIKTTLALDGAEAFKRNLKSVDSELSVLAKELSVLTSKYNESEGSMANYSGRQKILAEQISLNESKVKALKEAVAASTDQYEKAKQNLDEMKKSHAADSDEVINAAKALRSAEIEMDSYRKKLADSENALNKSISANRENQKAMADLEAQEQANRKAAAELEAQERANQKATAELEAQNQKYISLLSELTRVESESAKIIDKSQQGISRFTQNTRLLSAQIESLTVSYGDNERKMPSLIGRISNLTERQKLLKEQVENSQKKVNALNSAVSASQDVYDAAVKNSVKMSQAYGANSEEAKNAAASVEKARSTLTDYKTQLAEAKVELVKSKSALKDFNDENGKTKVGRAFGEFKDAVSEITAKFKPLTSAIKNVSEAAAKITFKSAEISAKAFTSTVETSMKAAYSAVSTYTKAFGTATAAALGTAAAAVGGLAKSAVESYGEYEQLVGGIDTLFEDLSWDIEQNATNAYKTAGLSANEYMETVMSFGASLNQSLKASEGNIARSAKIADQTITDMADNANKMGTSMESIQSAYQGFAKQNYTMLDNLKLGYGGTKEEMERLLVDAEKLSGQKYDISSFADIAEAIHVVQTEMGITGTTAKEAASTIQGSLSSMKSAWSNLVTGIANDNADFDSLISNFVDSAGSVAENLIPRIEIALNGVGKLVEKMVPVLVEKIPPLVSNVLPNLLNSATQLLQQTTSYINKSLPKFVSKTLPKLVEQIQNVLPEILSQLTTGFNNIILTIADVVIAGLPVVTQTILPQMISATTKLVTELVKKLSQLLPRIIEGAVTLFRGLIDGLNKVADVLLPMLPGLVGQLVQAVSENLPAFSESAFELFSKLLEALDNVVNELVPELPGIISNICDELILHVDEIFDTGFELLINLSDGIVECIPTLLEKLPQIITKIVNKLTSPANIKKMLDVGVKLIQYVAKGFPDAVGSIAENIPTIIKNIWNALIEVDWLTLGINIVEGILKGFLNVGQIIWDYVGSFKDSVMSTVKGIFGIHSPSKLMEEEVGKNLALGVGEGFTDNMSRLSKDMADSIPRNFDTSIDLDFDARRTFQIAGALNASNPQVEKSYSFPININIEHVQLNSDADIRKTSVLLARETQKQLAAVGMR